MKKLALIALLFSGIYLAAQGHGEKRDGMKDLNPEQIATLRTKKMTLALDLDQSQQKEIYSVMLSNAQFRKTKMEERKKKKGSQPSKEERYAKQNERLDQKIAQKAEMKQLLTEAQFNKWEKMNDGKTKDKKVKSKKRYGRS